jgi:hypothetical protein
MNPRSWIGATGSAVRLAAFRSELRADLGHTVGSRAVLDSWIPSTTPVFRRLRSGLELGTGSASLQESCDSVTVASNPAAPLGSPKPSPYRVKRWAGFDGPAVSPQPRGPLLFEEVRGVIEDHYCFPKGSEWAYDIAALWVMQVYVSAGLNSVFYLLLAGSKGDGKTSLIDLLCFLSGAINAADISVAALVHALEETPDRAVALDEFGVLRDAEKDSAMTAIARNGYTRGKPYIRFNVKTGQNDECPTFGAKVFGFRGAVDPALEDRGFPLPCVKYVGPGGFRYVQANDGPTVGDLPRRLGSWASDQRTSYPTIREGFKSPRWEETVRKVLADKIGANRESQLTSVALQVSRLCCIDVGDSLKAALGLRAETSAANFSTSLAEAFEILSSLSTLSTPLSKEAQFYIVAQREFTAAVNAKRRERHERALSSSELAALRRDLGILDTWLTRPQNKTTWNIPAKEWARLTQGSDSTKPPSPSAKAAPNPQPNQPNLANPVVKDEEVRQVSQVSHGEGDPTGALRTRSEVRAETRASFDEALGEEGEGS